MSFDITLAFDKAQYLNPQARLFIDTLKDNIPEDTILHVVTNRGKDDEIRKYIKENVNSKFYFIKKSDELKSRCRYMLNSFKIRSDKEWVMKAELDLLFLKPLTEYNKLLKNDLDIVIESENRKIFSDSIEERLWRQMYRAMGMKPTDVKIQFRENNETGLILFGTGLFFVRNKLLDTINKRWIELTKKCEPWGQLGVHPNEQALSALVQDEGWRWSIYPDIYKYNIIGHYRANPFPDTTLIEPAILPDNVVCLDWHHLKWLQHIAKFNPKVKTIIDRNKQYIPKEMWDMSTVSNMSINKVGF